MKTAHCNMQWLLICVLLIVTQVVVSCRKDYKTPHPTLLLAEQLMNERPDSALRLLEDSIDPSRLSGKNYADWCSSFVRSVNEYRNYVTLDYYPRVIVRFFMPLKRVLKEGI